MRAKRNGTYEALNVDTLRRRLGHVADIAERAGGDSASWRVREVGDGNLNLVFIVEGDISAVVIKQALPYVRLVGESWPLPLYRALYEYHALIRQGRRSPGSTPEVYHFDEKQALIAMEYLTPHRILRRQLIDGERIEHIGQFLGEFCARTAFRGSELSMGGADKKADVSLFSGNVEIPAITEALVFTDPYRNVESNRHTPGLDPVVSLLRGDVELKACAQRMLMRFASNAETMVHGDLHTGSIMTDGRDIRVIDPEFAQYGPLGFDIGVLVANFLMAYFSQPAHRGEAAMSYQEWILGVIVDCLEAFDTEFSSLWTSERTGMLYPSSLFEEQGHSSAGAREALLSDIRADCLAVCGIEMHRRSLSLAHNADFEEIPDIAVRARLEARSLMMGRDLVLKADSLSGADDVLAMAREFNERTVL